ncbi:MAG: NAD-dependent succinate-semialdehyde dehydrogenase [Spirochaetia bacterium]|nr:NAD-dependent succinate-semialdehyde dehydrogenase [Spirochaetia bacterium]
MDVIGYSGRASWEMGKPITQSLGEIEKCAWVCEYYGDHAKRQLEGRIVKTDAKESSVRYEPLGVVLAVMPWNFPFWQVFRFAAPALSAGNAALLKHASNVPGCALAIESVFQEAGFPRGTLSTLLVNPVAVEEIIADPRVAAVTLTGSTKAGSEIASIAGRHIKKTVLELGGSDAFIVLADADLDKAAKAAAMARTISNGQSCIAAKRFIVVSKVAEAFAERFTRALSEIRTGDPTDPETQLGPLARDDIRRELHDKVIRSRAAGAHLALGGEIPSTPGFYYPVTLLTGVTPGMPAADTETFGPVAALMTAEDEAQAVHFANASPFGLAASLWTRDKTKAKTLAKEIDVGSVFVNGVVKSDPRLPFGGVRQSGYGRELSEEGIREFVNVKTLWIGD